jgi:transposase-like protein
MSMKVFGEFVKMETSDAYASAVKLANESGKSVAQVTLDLGINLNTLHTWAGKYAHYPGQAARIPGGIG